MKVPSGGTRTGSMRPRTSLFMATTSGSFTGRYHRGTATRSPSNGKTAGLAGGGRSSSAPTAAGERFTSTAMPGFKCRTCHGLSYPSQRERDSDRAQRRANRIRVRLGGDPGWTNIPPRPKGMHWRTYERQIARIVEADAITDRYAAERFGLSP